MHVVPVDVTGSEDSLKAFAETVVSTVPHVDYCFLAAGVFLWILTAGKHVRVFHSMATGFASPQIFFNLTTM